MKRYKNASELYDIFYEKRKEDIVFYNGIVGQYKSEFDNNRVIEIGAGTGRVLLPIAKAHPDLEFHAVDIIGDEIEVLKEKASYAGIKNIVTHVADINEFQSKEKFSFAFAPFRVLQHCQSVADLDRMLKSTKELLSENGRFTFDLFNPWLHMMVKEGVVFDGNYHDREGNTINRRVEINHRDYFKQTQDIEEYYTVKYTDGKKAEFEWLYTTGYFFKDTAAMVLEKNDLNVDNLYSGFDRRPFGQGEYPGDLIFDCIKNKKGLSR
ncbi:MAG: class I SAM-dependent methyltransferase [Alphaproteobacteria bacterium]|nr:class I SAM-dependent methyltransferase [Alphaproteobacteria bacterium]